MSLSLGVGEVPTRGPYGPSEGWGPVSCSSPGPPEGGPAGIRQETQQSWLHGFFVHRVDTCGTLYCEGGRKPLERSSCTLTLRTGTCQALALEGGAAYEPVPEGTKCGEERVSARARLLQGRPRAAAGRGFRGLWPRREPGRAPCGGPRHVSHGGEPTQSQGCAHRVLCGLSRGTAGGREVLKQPVLRSRGVKTILFCKPTPPWAWGTPALWPRWPLWPGWPGCDGPGLPPPGLPIRPRVCVSWC